MFSEDKVLLHTQSMDFMFGCTVMPAYFDVREAIPQRVYDLKIQILY